MAGGARPGRVGINGRNATAVKSRVACSPSTTTTITDNNTVALILAAHSATTAVVFYDIIL